MSLEQREKRRAELTIGEMPIPLYMSLIDSNANGNKPIKRIESIGIKAYAIDGKIKSFRLYTNLPIRNLNIENERNYAAATVALINLRFGTHSAIGPAVDYLYSDEKAKRIKLFDDSAGYHGLYIAEKKLLFPPEITFIEEMVNSIVIDGQNPTDIAKAMEKAKTIQGDYQNFDINLIKARAVLPRPNILTTPVIEKRNRIAA